MDSAAAADPGHSPRPCTWILGLFHGGNEEAKELKGQGKE